MAKTKREKLHEYLTRPETPEDIKAAWLELDRHVATLTRDLQLRALVDGVPSLSRRREQG